MSDYVSIAPSVLSADWSNLKPQLEDCEEAECEYLHFDVMDGHFVKNISFGVPVLKSIAKSHKMINDVHLMISDPLTYAPKFIEAGADIITFHYEALDSLFKIDEMIRVIHSFGKKAGISIKPKTPLEAIKPFLNDVDLVLVMSVEPGFGGQKFDRSALAKILMLRSYLQENKEAHYLIEVDGGINDETAPLCRVCGADILVAGSYVFKGDIKENVRKLRV